MNGGEHAAQWKALHRRRSGSRHRARHWRIFLDEGASVALVDRSLPSQASSADGSSAWTSICDVSQREEVEATFAEATSDLGGLDGLVNAAGVERRSLAEDIDDAEWDDVLNVNLRGTFLTDQIAFPYLKERGGRIVNFGSDSGLIPHPGGAHYAASKGGVIAWTRSIASEWGKYRITANTVLPAMKTPMYEEHRQRFTPEEIARFDESKHCGATSARRTIGRSGPRFGSGSRLLGQRCFTFHHRTTHLDHGWPR